MSTPVGPAAAIAPLTADPLAPLGSNGALPVQGGPGAFGQLLLNGVQHVSQQVNNAERLTTEFALNDSVPLHQVTFALQQARLSLEFMLQVRSHVLEAYQQFANLQI